ncbi:damage-inducible protein CinA [Limnohabitans sp. JirII-29]|uniref:CinA family protein n=1 Tax=Limnohabitans sp. JirII-29 TaxID=1835756 RepID=UPI000D3A3BB1|nr:CinA family protein [Limnohabitans sp. JirII-29]PUE27606.1 damage-inducible protein CinA [Limnohabitans sp. JirII-29]
MAHDNTSHLVEQLADALLHHGWMLATAESCTGGMIAARCTDLSGSSQWLERGFVSYSNEAKHEMLGVDPALIAQHGAVSAEVAQAMALGALRHSQAQVSLAVTGVAGPTGGSADKPVGTVWLAWALPSDSGPTLGADTAWVKTECVHFKGDRAAVREATLQHALATLLHWLRQH